jgi:hypothetical protein
MRRLTSCFQEGAKLGWPIDVLKVQVSLLRRLPGLFWCPNRQFSFLKPGSARLGERGFQKQKGDCGGKDRHIPDRRIRARRKTIRILPVARAARRLPDLKAACFAMLTLVPECALVL